MSLRLAFALLLSLATACGGGRDGGGDDDDMMEESMLPGTGPTLNVDPSCIDGQYREELPMMSMPIQDAKDAFTGDVNQLALDVLAARSPVGFFLVDQTQNVGVNGTDENCVEFFAWDTSSADAIIGDISTIVHECGHVYDSSNAADSFTTNHFAITETLSFTCEGGDTTTRGGNTFARSRITGDAFHAMRPPCEGQSSETCDFYGPVYLDGNPDDDRFEGGDQGYNSVVEEALQYTNSLATGFAFVDQQPPGRFITEMDGILTFMWYIGRYLRYARDNFPDAYNFILNDQCYRELTLTIWGRGWLLLEAAMAFPQLGINNEILLGLVNSPDILDEIQRLRDAQGC